MSIKSRKQFSAYDASGRQVKVWALTPPEGIFVIGRTHINGADGTYSLEVLPKDIYKAPAPATKRGSFDRNKLQERIANYQAKLERERQEQLKREQEKLKREQEKLKREQSVQAL